MRKNLNIAIIGATGLVGRKIIEVLSERKIEANYFLFALESGEKICILDKLYTVEKLDLSKIKDML